MLVDHELNGSEHAPVLVLSNSLGADRHMWDAQTAALRAEFRVLRYDQRGHGATAAPPGPYDLESLGGDVLELLDHHGIERAHFAGLSLGGMTGMWLARHAPERVDRLALLCTSAALDPAGWHNRAEFVRANGSAAMVAGTLPRWFTSALSGRPDIEHKYGGMIAACDDEGYAGCCEAIARMELSNELHKITSPTLVVAGYDDPATPPEHGRRIAEGIADARVEVLSSAAHLANVEQPEQVNHLLLEHFTTRSV